LEEVLDKEDLDKVDGDKAVAAPEAAGVNGEAVADGDSWEAAAETKVIKVANQEVTKEIKEASQVVTKPQVAQTAIKISQVKVAKVVVLVADLDKVDGDKAVAAPVAAPEAAGDNGEAEVDGKVMTSLENQVSQVSQASRASRASQAAAVAVAAAVEARNTDMDMAPATKEMVIKEITDPPTDPLKIMVNASTWLMLAMN